MWSSTSLPAWRQCIFCIFLRVLFASFRFRMLSYNIPVPSRQRRRYIIKKIVFQQLITITPTHGVQNVTQNVPTRVPHTTTQYSRTDKRLTHTRITTDLLRAFLDLNLQCHRNHLILQQVTGIFQYSDG